MRVPAVRCAVAVVVAVPYAVVSRRLCAVVPLVAVPAVVMAPAPVGRRVGAVAEGVEGFAFFIGEADAGRLGVASLWLERRAEVV